MKSAAYIKLPVTGILAVALFQSLESVAADNPAAPVCLGASHMSIASGQPSLVMMPCGDVQTPVWSLSGGTVGQSVAGVIDLPGGCTAVKVEIVVTTSDATTSPNFEDVYRVHLSQLVANGPNAYFTTHNHEGNPVRTALPAAATQTRTIVLDSRCEVAPNTPLWVRIQREPGDDGDTFTKPTGLAMVMVTPVGALTKPQVVQDVHGYNSWPMIQAIGDKLVCVYSRGAAHSIGEDARAVYARTSSDGGKTWTAETVVANTPGYGEVEVGKGLDSTGAMLLWVRRVGKAWGHDLYRTADGVKFELISTPKLEVQPMQITDVFAVPTVGLMALWFAGNYGEGPNSSWGMVTSSDDGKTWKQTPVESGLIKSDWPTEPAAAYLGDGKILAIARTETGPTQFQMISTDYGATWKRERTNIGDVTASTPSLILDAKTGLLSNYYYQRGKGLLRRRVVHPDKVFNNPQNWPASEVVATGGTVTFDAGNANATAIAGTHYVSFYSGKAPDTAVLMTVVPAPSAGDK